MPVVFVAIATLVGWLSALFTFKAMLEDRWTTSPGIAAATSVLVIAVILFIACLTISLACRPRRCERPGA